PFRRRRDPARALRPPGRVGRQRGRPARGHLIPVLRLADLLDRPGPEPLRVPGGGSGFGPDQPDRRYVQVIASRPRGRSNPTGPSRAPFSRQAVAFVVPKGVGTSWSSDPDRPWPPPSSSWGPPS